MQGGAGEGGLQESQGARAEAASSLFFISPEGQRSIGVFQHPSVGSALETRAVRRAGRKMGCFFDRGEGRGIAPFRF